MATESLSLLFAKKQHGPNLSDVDQAKGFIVRYGENKEQCQKIAKEFQPDIVLVDTGVPCTIDAASDWAVCLDAIPFVFKPGYFLALDNPPSLEDKWAFRKCGFDEVITKPVLAEEIRYMAQVYLRHKTQAQTIFTNKQTLKQAHVYLDRFRHSLSQVKNELVQEKNSLNNALKQIHHLTRERRYLKQQIKEVKHALKQNMEGVEKLLFRLIRNQVETNRGHGERVAHIACFMGKELGFDEKKLEDLTKAAMLHEVGLVFMPRPPVKDVSDHPTDYERNIQVQYPVKGADLLDLCNAFAGVSQIIRHMHENVDGTGYPSGLKKQYIPMASRVLAGADTFDTLKDSDRINCLEDLLTALEEMAGARLDPLVVSWLGKYALLHMGSDDFQIRGVGVGQLTPGMRLGCALFTAAGTKLYAADTVLTMEAIDKIIQYSREYPVDDVLYIKV